jgi:hypothetical protein
MYYLLDLFFFSTNYNLFLIEEIVLDKQKIILYLHSISGCSVARLSRLLWEQEAAGSNPATPTKNQTAMFGFFCIRYFMI